ncbi:hypothetical protein [Candidatus Methylobacter favarea]|uniref:hypothetical protein n=1 Tax=Candidatus Methylobacter favarea TaxID=2707345 RepID=UPI00157C1ED8|nr:hypothetical protein [Candidatus Methylobacter favarea]
MKMDEKESRALISNYQKLELFKTNKRVYLSPQRKIDVINDSVVEHKAVIINSDFQLVLEVTAHCQSVDYMCFQRLSCYQ